MQNYIVYWKGNERGFNKFKEASDYVKECIRGQIKFDTALMINRKNPKNVRMYSIHWNLVFDLFEYTIVKF